MQKLYALRVQLTGDEPPGTSNQTSIDWIAFHDKYDRNRRTRGLGSFGSCIICYDHSHLTARQIGDQ
jgi:hypothetical protein